MTVSACCRFRQEGPLRCAADEEGGIVHTPSKGTPPLRGAGCAVHRRWAELSHLTAPRTDSAMCEPPPFGASVPRGAAVLAPLLHRVAMRPAGPTPVAAFCPAPAIPSLARGDGVQRRLAPAARRPAACAAVLLPCAGGCCWGAGQDDTTMCVPTRAARGRSRRHPGYCRGAPSGCRWLGRLPKMGSRGGHQGPLPQTSEATDPQPDGAAGSERRRQLMGALPTKDGCKERLG